MGRILPQTVQQTIEAFVQRFQPFRIRSKKHDGLLFRDTFGKQANQRISARQTGQRRRFKQQFKVFNHLFIGNIAVMNVMRTVQQDISRIRHMGFSIDDDVAVSLHKQIDFALTQIHLASPAVDGLHALDINQPDFRRVRYRMNTILLHRKVSSNAFVVHKSNDFCAKIPINLIFSALYSIIDGKHDTVKR